VRDSTTEERAPAHTPALAAKDLEVLVPGRPDPLRIIDGISFEIAPGETLGLTGPSGAGKTTLALALAGLRPDGEPALLQGSIRVGGREMVGLDDREWSSVRGGEIGLIPQDPGSSLTPVRRVGDLILEVAGVHAAAGGPGDAHDLLAEVGFDDPESIAGRYPFELSGGMQQRVAIAAALAGQPNLLVADEPTSSLDPIAGAQVMELLESLQGRRSMAVLLISHDRRELVRRADRVVELRDGRLRSGRGPQPRPTARPVSGSGAAARGPRFDGTPPLLELEDLRMTFGGRGLGDRPVGALEGVSLRVEAGDSVGLVGPTGSGKSTLARCAVRLLEPTGGSVAIKGRDVTRLSPRRIRAPRASIGMVIQSPSSSFNPRRRLYAAIEAPLRARRIGDRKERRRLVREAAEAARLDPDLLRRRPGELSGGQLQRAALARALVTGPELLILDEPFTALDEETEAELVDLLADLREERGLALLLITHDLRLVLRLTARVAVMASGRIVESGPTDHVVRHPAAGVTRALVEASLGA